ncbi:DUF2513 domain-containing protein [Staphylococcus equorum]|uniref:DUF2513 domain-containing protein n=1 Tax=Staphylococcus equorum TaxID=246432 RepID=UPI00031702BC|nr:DUF2513 domain-containing protein [Staphylococcus equorum]
MDYFKLYETILLALRNTEIDDGYKLMKHLSYDPYIQKLRSEKDEQIIKKDIFNVVDNALTDNVIKGTRNPTMDEPVYCFKGLSTKGHKYLDLLSDDSNFKKLKKFAKKQGASISAFSPNYLLDNLLQ